MFMEKIKRIKVLYTLALSLIALTIISSSLLVQRIALSNTSDSRLINISGRQRMLSQRMTKCVLALRYVTSPAQQNSYLEELNTSLQAWKAAHAGLQWGDARLGLPYQAKLPQLQALFAEATPYHAAMVAAFTALLKSSREHGLDAAAIGRAADVVLANEPRFLALMDKITFRFDFEAKQRVNSLRMIEVVILIIGLSLLALECIFVFLPSLRQLASMMESITTQSQLLAEEIEVRRRAEKLLQEEQQHLESRVAEEVKKNREKDRMLIQNDKMASLGQVAAGVAHEINNPICYITGNLSILADYFDQLVRYDRAIREICLNALPLPTREQIERTRDSLEIDQALDDGGALIGETREGTLQIAEIVKNLKNFSRMDDVESKPVLLRTCLESALIIVYNELKYVATAIRKEYEETPMMLCHFGQLSQVFLNLLVNAGHAIAPSGEITLKCWCDVEYVYASVSDTGSGIPEEIRSRILEPFFTTKEVGKGTGLGLSISLDIVKRHHGDLLIESEVGRGSTFTVRLPRTLEWLGDGAPLGSG